MKKLIIASVLAFVCAASVFAQSSCCRPGCRPCRPCHRSSGLDKAAAIVSIVADSCTMVQMASTPVVYAAPTAAMPVVSAPTVATPVVQPVAAPVVYCPVRGADRERAFRNCYYGPAYYY